jgi:hypothetical protein
VIYKTTILPDLFVELAGSLEDSEIVPCVNRNGNFELIFINSTTIGMLQKRMAR